MAKGKKHIDWHDQRTQIRRLLRRGITRTEMAKAIGVTTPTLLTRLREMGVVDPKKVKSGKKA